MVRLEVVASSLEEVKDCTKYMVESGMMSLGIPGPPTPALLLSVVWYHPIVTLEEDTLHLISTLAPTILHPIGESGTVPGSSRNW